jgi:hypothetical protein
LIERKKNREKPRFGSKARWNLVFVGMIKDSGSVFDGKES